MSYQIKFTDQKRFPADVINVSDTFFNGPVNPGNPAYYTSLTGSANNASTTLTLAGRGVVDYGMPIQQSVIYLLEHFANYRSPVYPQPGQVWYKPRLRDTTPGNEEAFIATDPTEIGLYIYRGSATPGGPKPEVWDAIPVSGYMHQPFDMSDGSGGRNRITGLADATTDYDAVSRLYGDARYINAVGSDTKDGTLTFLGTGQVVLPNAPTVGTHATNKDYVDTTIQTEVALAIAALSGTLDAIYVNQAGDTMTGTLTLQSGDLVVQTGNFNIPIGSATMGIGNLTLQSGSINMPAGGSINIGTGNLNVGAGTSTFSGPSTFAAMASFINGLNVTGTSMAIVGSAVTLSSGATITGLSTPTLPADAVNKDYVDNLALSLGADGVVSSGNIDPVTGVVTLNRTIGLPDVVLSGAVAPLTHTHQSDTVYHPADPPIPTSFIRDQLIDQPIWPNNVTLQTVLDLFDDALSEIRRPYGRQIIVSDGTTATYELDREVRVSHNQLQVYVDGVKWIGSQFAEGQFNISPSPRSSDDSGLAVSTAYAFNLTVNGTPYVNFTITTPGTTPINYHTVAQLIDARLVTLGVPAVCVISAGQIRILSTVAGAGSSVVLAAPSAGTNLFTSFSGTATPLSETISTTYAYFEVGIPYELTGEFTFTTIPPAGTTIELLTLTR